MRVVPALIEDRCLARHGCTVAALHFPRRIARPQASVRYLKSPWSRLAVGRKGLRWGRGDARHGAAVTADGRRCYPAIIPSRLSLACCSEKVEYGQARR